jgi:3-methyladenine DNA glycosylase AlkC
MTEQERLGISDETMKAMKEFFVKHSLPKILEEERKKKDEKVR